MEYFEFRAMNSAILMAAEGQHAWDGFDAAQSFINAAEERFSRFRDTSELSRLNRSAGTPFAASFDMFSLLEVALECHRQTEGLFDPSILPDLQRIGYTRSMDDIRRFGVDEEPARRSRERSLPFELLTLEQDGSLVHLPTGMQIDLGGIAKGWIAEQAAHLLAGYSPACAVSAGGDMFVVGHPEGETGWDIGLEDPREPSRDLTTLWVEAGAVATSSVVKRAWKQGELSRHHLIDPRNGEPAQSPWLSVTVFAPHAATAEAFAKAILIGGPEPAKRMLARDPEVSFLAVDTEGQLWNSYDQKELVHVDA